MVFFFFFQAEDGIRDYKVTGVQTCALPISPATLGPSTAPPSRTRRSTVTPVACTCSSHAPLKPGCGNIPDPGVAHVSVTSGVPMMTSAVTLKNPSSPITSPAIAALRAARKSASLVTMTAAGVGQEVIAPAENRGLAGWPGSVVDSRQATKKPMAARAAGR